MQLQDARYLTLLLKEEDSPFCCKHTVFGTGSQVLRNRESYGPQACSGRTLSDDWWRSTRAYSLESRQKLEININTIGWVEKHLPIRGIWGKLQIPLAPPSLHQAIFLSFPTFSLLSCGDKSLYPQLPPAEPSGGFVSAAIQVQNEAKSQDKPVICANAKKMLNVYSGLEKTTINQWIAMVLPHSCIFKDLPSAYSQIQTLETP